MLLRLELHDDVKVPDTKRSECRFSLHRIALPKHMEARGRFEQAYAKGAGRAPGAGIARGGAAQSLRTRLALSIACVCLLCSWGLPSVACTAKPPLTYTTATSHICPLGILC